MKIKLLKTTACDGKMYAAGSVVDASNKDAQYLIGVKKAVLFVAEKKPRKAPANKAIQAKDLEQR